MIDRENVNAFDRDFVVVGSGFGGSVAALRLVEKGYDVLVIEQGREFAAADFPKSNWNLKRWLWAPGLGMRGFFRISFFRHVTVLSGVGVGGGSIVYACTHPVPKPSFFNAPEWSQLADWDRELEPHYATAKRMLGVTRTPFETRTDLVLREIAHDRGTPQAFQPTDVAIYFGEPGKTVDDPYFDGDGPQRTGCIRCGGCMLGCRFGAKNSLDRNYLHLARKRGAALWAETKVTAIRPLPEGGYLVEMRRGGRWRRHRLQIRARNVVLAGGVLGTVPLLLRMQADPRGLPALSPRLGGGIRTNSEALIGVIAEQRSHDLSKGIAIGSILQTDEHSHLEPVRFPAGSGIFRVLMAPHVYGEHALARLARTIAFTLRHPVRVLRGYLVPDFAKYTTILLYMRTAEGSLRLKPGRWGGLTTTTEGGKRPTAAIPAASALANDVAAKLQGTPFSLVTEPLLDIPTTAHILGGCCMGEDATTGVVDPDHRVFGYAGLYVMDGSTISANPGVNPSLTIVAMAERAMSKIASKHASASDVSSSPLPHAAATP